MKHIILTAVMALLAFNGYGQSIIKCSPQEIYWYIKGETANYAIKLSGDIAEGNFSDLLNVEDKVLQYQVLDANYYFEKNSENSEEDILKRYYEGETAHLAEMYGKPMDIQMQMIFTEAEKLVMLWNYKIPEGASEQVESQLMANVVFGDKIFLLASPQLNWQEFNDVKAFLTEAITNTRPVEGESGLCSK
ncbi:MAG TPA: hypothetical protein VEA37_15250 [Flavobacterium sp.]|nr:hypothetical protein [Flavobacterium sp.]